MVLRCKSRLDLLQILQGSRRHYAINDMALAYWARQKLAAALMDQLTRGPQEFDGEQAWLAELAITDERHVRIASEGEAARGADGPRIRVFSLRTYPRPCLIFRPTLGLGTPSCLGCVGKSFRIDGDRAMPAASRTLASPSCCSAFWSAGMASLACS